MNAIASPTASADADERIAATLLGRGRLKDADLARAQRLQAEAGGSLGSLLVRLGLVSERDMAEAASEVLGRVIAVISERRPVAYREIGGGDTSGRFFHHTRRHCGAAIAHVIQAGIAGATAGFGADCTLRLPSGGICSSSCGRSHCPCSRSSVRLSGEIGCLLRNAFAYSS